VLTLLTGFATFLMGFIDAYTYMEHNGVFVSAQTGNIIVFSAKMFSGDWHEAAGHITVFAGFAAGAFIGEAIIERSGGGSLGKYRTFLLAQGVLLLGLAIFQHAIGQSIMVFALGLLSGYELSVFRKIGSTTINNGIMTGNTKNMMNKLYRAVFDRDREAGRDFRNLLIGLVLFILGVGTGALVVGRDEQLILWLAFVSNGLLFVWLLAAGKRKKAGER